MFLARATVDAAPYTELSLGTSGRAVELVCSGNDIRRLAPLTVHSQHHNIRSLNSWQNASNESL